MPGRIHIIDQNAERRAALAQPLRCAYFDVTECRNAESAPTPPPDLIICDFSPEAMRKLGAGGPPVIVLGGPGAREAFAAGAEDHIARPVSPALLLARARALIRRRRMTDELKLRLNTTRELGLLGEAETGGAGAPQILLISAPDDEGRALCKELDQNAGAAVRMVTSGFAALRAAETRTYDAIIVADEPPEPGGFSEEEDMKALISALRARAPDNVIIHLPAFETSPAEAERRALAALAAGATDCAGHRDELSARLSLHVATWRTRLAMSEQIEGGMRLAALDPLTTLHNRRYFDLHFARITSHAAENGIPLAVFLLDLDQFKTINDRFGHQAGDEALRIFAARLRDAVRGADLVARYGGEEFVVVLKGAGEQNAIAAAERVRRAAAGAPVSFSGGQCQLTVSAGVAVSAAGDSAAEILLARADFALRRAKRAGRNRVETSAA